MTNKYTENAVKSYIDYDESLRLETNSIGRKVFNVIFIPLLNSLPNNFKHLIKKTNKSASVVIDNATNHKALEVLYSKGELFSVNRLLDTIFRYIWFNMNNSKAVRNRLKFVKREIEDQLTKRSKFDDDIELISIASGSSRAVVEIVKNAHYLKPTKLSVTFLDKDENAINYSKNLSTTIQHLPISLNWIHDSIGNFLRSHPNRVYDVVEMVGLLDYFTDEKVVETFKGIYSIMSSGGAVITANINHNSEEKFVSKVIDWNMMYRDADKLADLISQAGFNREKMKVFYEPLLIHGIVVAEK